MVGHAIFQTAEESGPSMIDRSYRRAPVEGTGCGTGGEVGSTDAVSRSTEAGISVTGLDEFVKRGPPTSYVGNLI
jgi:hypothetical protein